MKKRLVQLEINITQRLLSASRDNAVLVISDEAEWRLSSTLAHDVFYCGKEEQAFAGFRYFRSEVDFLAVAPEAVNLLVLPHVLIRPANLDDVLNECDLVLQAEGQLLIFGINDSQQYSADDISKCLQKRGYQIMRHRGYHTIPALTGHVGEVIDRCFGQFFPWLSNSYWLLAKKRVYAATPIKVKWKKTPRLGQVKTRPVAGSFRKEEATDES